MIHITIRDGARYYRATVTPAWAQRHDTGSLISTGLTVGINLTRSAFEHMTAIGCRLEEITEEQYRHSGCQSACTLRGDPACRW